MIKHIDFSMAASFLHKNLQIFIVVTESSTTQSHSLSIVFYSILLLFEYFEKVVLIKYKLRHYI